MIKIYRKNKPTSEEYGAANGGTLLADSEDLNDNSELQWIILSLRHHTYLNNVFLISMTWSGTIQGYIPTLMMKIGLLEDG